MDVALLAHVRTLVAALGAPGADGKGAPQALLQVADAFGPDGYLHVLHGALEGLDLREGRTAKDNPRVLLLAALFERLAERTSFPTLLAQALSAAAPSYAGGHDALLPDLLRAMPLPLPLQLALGIALAELPDQDARHEGRGVLLEKLPELSAAGGLAALSEPLAHRILVFLLAHEQEGFADAVRALRAQLAANMAPGTVPLHLIPLVTDDAREAAIVHDAMMQSGAELAARLQQSACHAAVLQELGYVCATTPEALRDVLALMPPLDERSLGQLVGMFARTHTGLDSSTGVYATLLTSLGANQSVPEPGSYPATWNLEVIADVLAQMAPTVSWPAAMMHLDRDGFMLPDQKSFLTLMQLYRRATPEPFPIQAVCSKVWHNVAGQLSFLHYALSAPQEVFTFAHSPHRQPPVEGLHQNKSAIGTVNQCWLSLDLLRTLMQISEAGHTGEVRALLEHPLKHCPEVLLLGVAQVESDWNLLQSEIFALLMPTYLAVHPNSSLVLHRMWTLKRSVVLRTMVDAHAHDNSAVARVLDVCQELKILTDVLAVTPYPFTVELAALAARREYLNLEKWLTEQISARGPQFAVACVRFLRERACGEQPTNKAGPVINLAVETMAIFFKVLHVTAPSMPQELGEELKSVFTAAANVNPKLQSLAQAISGGEGQQPAEAFSSEIEEEANSYFQKIYTSQQTIADVITMLKGFQASSVQREQKVFACMIHNLFDEYRFFPKYPDKELRTTAVLFGSLIQHDLVSSITLGIALRYVLDALRKQPGTKMYIFGSEALDQFKQRVVEWPQFCQHLLQIPHLRTSHQDLIAFLERSLGSGAGDAAAAAAASSTAPSAAASAIAASAPFAPSEQKESRPGASLFEPAAPAATATAPETTTMPLGSEAVMAQPFTPAQQRVMGLPPQPPISEQQQVEQQQAQHAAAAAATMRSPHRSPVVAPSGTPGLGSPSVLKLDSQTSQSPSVGFATSLNIDTLLAAPENSHVVLPEQAVQDKVHFIFNNLAVANLEQKAAEINNHVPENLYEWFSTYMVVKRASIEPNFHNLYLGVLDALNRPHLSKMVVHATHRNVRVLIRSELIKSSTGERSLLKNLGSWLGNLTIGKCRPVLQKNLDFKQLILEAFETGRMIAIIPFVAKILEPAKDSKVFNPPNPWVMALLALLAEIYAEKDLKLNLKFEIERLFKHLNVELKDVVPSQLVVGRRRDRLNNPDFVVDKAALAAAAAAAAEQPPARAQMPGMGMPLASGAASMAPPSGVPAEKEGDDKASGSATASAAATAAAAAAAAHPFNFADQQASIATLQQYIQISPSLNIVADRLQLKRVLPVALDRAIREIVSPVVERSVTIACMTTRELVLKDFAVETDENRIRQAAHLMVSSLAGSLALVTCKEHLRASVTNQLRNLLQQAVQQTGGLAGLEQGLLEQAVQVATGDNLELGCALIEKAATEKAVRDIDEALAPAYMARRKHREMSPGQPFYDMAVLQNSFVGVLPDSLRPKPGNMMNANQQRVYDDFARLPRAPPAAPPPGTPSQPPLPSKQPQQSLAQPPASSALAQQAPQQHSPALSPQQRPFPTGPGGMPPATLPPASGGAVPDSVIASVPEGLLGVSDPLGPAAAMAAVTASASGGEQVSASHIQELFHARVQRLDALIAKEPPQTAYVSLPAEHELRSAVAEVHMSALKVSNTEDAALAMAQKVFKRLFDKPGSRLHVGANVAILEGLHELSKRVVKEVTGWLLFSDEDRKFNRDIVEDLVRARLVNMGELDTHLAKLLAGARGATALEFTAHLVQRCVVVEKVATASDFFNVLDVLQKVAARPGAPEALGQLVEQANAVGRAGKDDAAPPAPMPGRKARGPDPAGLREQVAHQFDEWARVCDMPAGDAAYASYVAGLQAAGLLSPEDNQERFFRILTELAIAHCLGSEAPQAQQGSGGTQQLNYAAVDAFARLVMLLTRTYAEAATGQSNPNQMQRLGVVARGLNAVMATLMRDADERATAFNPRPYLRLLAGWMTELHATDAQLDMTYPPVLAILGQALLALQPLRVPGFALAWLELVSHRCFMPRLLMDHRQKGWPLLQRLLTSVLRFMEPYLRNAEMTDPVRLLYKGTLRVLLVLLHDFPEFLCDHHFSFCDAIPPSCIQMRNLVLSAFPRNMRLPDPFTPNLKVDLLPEITQSPRVAADADVALGSKQLRADVDAYLKSRQSATFTAELRQRLLLSQGDAARAGTHYNVPLMNALVLYVGTQAIQANRKEAASPITHSAPMEVFQRLVVELDTEGRYLFLNAIANQLRYPNNHTHYFSCVLLYLFAEASQEIIQEQITRVLLERLIVNRPHPWGLLITFIELIKNPRYNFWSHSFTRCAPELERLFESVARSCMGPPPKGGAGDEEGAQPGSTVGLQVQPTMAG